MTLTSTPRWDPELYVQNAQEIEVLLARGESVIK